MKVGIDAGHGSNTAGKRTPNGYREHWINVRSAYFFELACQRCGFETVRIGWNDTNAKDDADISLSQRQKLIKNARCDFSVSWHANAFGNGVTYNSGEGVETLYHSYSSLAKDSKRLAESIQKYIIQGTPQKNRGAKPMDLAMCNARIMGTKASVLIEIAFMTNKREADLMLSDAFCKEQAEQACQGLCEYTGKPYIKDGGVVRYKAHVQNIGWQNEVKNGETAGTTGKALRMEAIVIDGDANFTYQVHCQQKGDMKPVTNGQIAGTTGQALRMEAINIECDKPIKYRVHVQGIGWMPWVNNGAWAGTRGQSRRMEAIEIKLV